MIEGGAASGQRAARPVCSLARRGLCKRGDQCPFRHPDESTTTTPASGGDVGGDVESHNMQRLCALNVPAAVTDDDIAKHLHVPVASVQRRGQTIFISFPSFEAATGAVAAYTDNSIVRLPTGQHFRVEFVRRVPASAATGSAPTAGRSAQHQQQRQQPPTSTTPSAPAKRAGDAAGSAQQPESGRPQKRSRFWTLEEYTR